MFFQKAYEGRNSWWRWLLTIVATLLAWGLGQIPLVFFIFAEASRLGIVPANMGPLLLNPGLNRNVFLLLGLLPFVLGLATFRLCIVRLHKKPMLSVITGRSRFDWGRAFVGFAVWMVLIAASSFALLPSTGYTYQFNPSAFWPLLAIALFLIPIQTTTEEIFFRGYLMQGLSLLLKNKLAPLILIIVIFAAVHVGNPEFYTDYLTGFLGYLAISTLLGFAAVMDDGLEIPCGIHAANNIFAVAILSARDGTFSTDSIFVSSVKDLMAFSPYIDIGLAAGGFVIFAVIYKWRASTLFEPTVPAERPDQRDPGALPVEG
jgi:membrane protease YdiL (CAAX protease family)